MLFSNDFKAVLESNKIKPKFDKNRKKIVDIERYHCILYRLVYTPQTVE